MSTSPIHIPPIALIPATVPWGQVKAVLFDVDGTLYNQASLRSRMLLDLAGYYAVRPWRLRDLLILQRFRAGREQHHGAAGPNLEAAQYNWGNEKAQVPLPQVRQVVAQWIFQRPNRFLAACAYAGVHDFFALLRKRGIKIGIYSDYPAQAKLLALGLSAEVVVSSTDADVDHLKPAPQGLLRACSALALAPHECLYIGDRPELDGVCAERAGMPWMLVEESAVGRLAFYEQLTQSLRQYMRL